MIVLGITLVLLLIFGKHFFASIPPKYYAIFNIFGKRWCARPEGLWFQIPYVESHELISKEMRRKEIIVTAKTKDLLAITGRGALKFFPDFNLLMRFDDSYKEIEVSIADEIESELGILAGTKDAKDFIHNRLAIALIINSRLRLKVMPHQRPELFGETRREIPIEERLDFYNRHQTAIEEMLEEENIDIVLGSRFLSSASKIPWFKKFAIRI